MVVFGVALVLLGAALLVAEAHVPSGVLGAVGGVTLTAGGLVVMAAADAGMWVILPVTVGMGLIASLWVAIAARKSLASQLRPVRSGAEGLSGEFGIVRNWAGADGQVLVAGALWRARHSWPEDDDDEEDRALHAGDPVIVERVRGLTLAVRKAEDWEGPW
jgi:membrane-bound ClpP family serine protease